MKECSSQARSVQPRINNLILYCLSDEYFLNIYCITEIAKYKIFSIIIYLNRFDAFS